MISHNYKFIHIHIQNAGTSIEKHLVILMHTQVSAQDLELRMIEQPWLTNQ